MPTAVPLGAECRGRCMGGALPTHHEALLRMLCFSGGCMRVIAPDATLDWHQECRVDMPVQRAATAARDEGRWRRGACVEVEGSAL